MHFAGLVGCRVIKEEKREIDMIYPIKSKN